MEKMKKSMRRLFATVLAMTLCTTAARAAAFENTHVNTSSGAGDIVSVALTQTGYIEGDGEYTKYGEWFGLPNAYWCAMFVSWCASQAEVPGWAVPKSASCTTGMNAFKNQGRFFYSPHRGGSYVPQGGDIIFYNWYGSSEASHAGIVLYAEKDCVYTVEGNTSTNRLDAEESYLKPEPVYGAEDDTEKEYVAVRCHKLSSIYILGYGHPNYAGEPFSAARLDPLSDIGVYECERETIEFVLGRGYMSKMSACTFGPDYGVSRAEFADCIARLYAIKSASGPIKVFSDVPATHKYYSSVMALRAAGVIREDAGEKFDPDAYITPVQAETTLRRVSEYTGLDTSDVSFSGEYVSRISMARALRALAENLVVSSETNAQILLDCEPAFLRLQSANGENYVLLDNLLELIGCGSGSAVQETDSVYISGAIFDETDQGERAVREAAEGEICRSIQGYKTVKISDRLFKLRGIEINGLVYCLLRDAAEAVGLDVAWDGMIILTRK